MQYITHLYNTRNTILYNIHLEYNLMTLLNLQNV
jgi:hypothetical protein